jgi:hypothetical protein
MPIQSVVMGYEPPAEYLGFGVEEKREVDREWSRQLHAVYPFKLRSRWCNRAQEEEYLATLEINTHLKAFFEELKPMLTSARLPKVTMDVGSAVDNARYTYVSDKEHRISYVRGFNNGKEPWTLDAPHPRSKKEVRAPVVVALTWSFEQPCDFYDDRERIEMLEAEIACLRAGARNPHDSAKAVGPTVI